ncbi:hypothetical protein [Alkalimarinus coralli]|uniref:hypothetical protein n=1 Tax=Alkalimarinus coralli TaxID=2935863 RepID=UPI00202AE466|nr:hypothetical protein [Alkalimarinus coralli]
MRNIILASISALSLTLSGCDKNEALGSNGEPICLNAASPFEYPVPTFVVTENLSRSSSWDYLQGIQPTDNVAGVPDMVTLMEGKIKQFAVYDGPVTGITSINNPIDTMDQVASAEDTAGNIQSGRVQIQGAINDNVSCSYNNRSAILRDEGNPDDTSNFLPYILDLSFISSSRQLTRTIAYFKEVTTIVDGKEEKNNEILATSVTALNPDTYSTSGNNAPLASEVTWGDSNESLKITKDYQLRIDRAAYVSATDFTVDGNTEINRFKISINYETGAAEIFISDFVNAVTCNPSNGDPSLILKDPTTQDLIDNHCENIEDRTTYRDPGYDVTGVDPDVEGSGTLPTPMTTYTGAFVDGR